MGKKPKFEYPFPRGADNDWESVVPSATPHSYPLSW